MPASPAPAAPAAPAALGSPWLPLAAIALLALALLALWRWRGGKPRATSVPPADATRPQAAADFQRAFAPLHATVHAEGTTFSGSQMSADLAALEPLALQAGAASAELAQLRWLQSVVWQRRGMPENALHAGRQALTLDMAAHRLPPAEQLARHHHLMDCACQAGQWATALEHLNAQQALLHAGHGHWSDSQRLGLREQQGYLLHEMGQHAQALTHNRQLLEDARAALGQDSPQLRNVLNNLAQNAYELQDLPQAEHWLHERLRIAQLPANAQAEQPAAIDTLFQLGVLAQEQNHPGQARQWFEQRLALARQSADENLGRQAQSDLTELARRTAPPASQPQGDSP